MLRFCIAIVCSFFFVSLAEAVQKSSEIPAKREFPISQTVDPCNDFYEYTCHDVNDSFQLRPDRQKHVFSLTDSTERLLKFKMEYFANLANQQPQGERETQLKNYYLACMNPAGRIKEEKQKVKDVLADLAKIQTREEMLNFLGSRMASTDPTFVSFTIWPNLDEPLTKMDLVVSFRMMSLPERSYYQRADVTKDLVALNTQFFRTIGQPKPAEKAQFVLDFEKGFALAYPTPEESRKLYSARTYVSRHELVKNWPHLQLENILKKIPSKTLVRNIVPAASTYLNDQLQSLSVDDIKTLYMYYALEDLLDDAYPSYFKKAFEFSNKHMGGSPQRSERHERCTKSVMSSFNKEVDSILWQRMFKNFPEQKVINVAERIRTAILNSLNENTWLSANAKKVAIQKMKAAKLQLVAPQNDLEWDFNPPAKYSDKTPIQNGQILSKLILEKLLSTLEVAPSPDVWMMGPLTVNAGYAPSYNKFMLPVGILQYPFFDVDASEEINLAALGTVIGHEIGHGLDDEGSKFNDKGQEQKWITPEDAATFKERSSFLVKQFDQVGHKGELTLGENIGDLVGLTASYRAAFLDSGKAVSLDEKKAFFVQYARLWCTVQLPKSVQVQLDKGPHALGRERVNQQVRQQPGFQEAFACKDGDKMTLPADKRVRIW